jgi:hypothetical protein
MIRHPKKRAYLKALEQVGAITVASDSAGINRDTPQDWRRKDEEFARLEQQALDSFADHLEAEAVRRARAGILKKRFDGKGNPIIDPATGEQYIEREYSDTMLIFLLKGVRPEKYRDKHEVRITRSDEEINAEISARMEELAAGRQGSVIDSTPRIDCLQPSQTVVSASTVAETAGVPPADGS